MSDRTIVAAAQFYSPAVELDRNLHTALDAVDAAAALDARLVVLPEYCISGYDAEWIRSGAPGGGVDSTGHVVTAMAELSARQSLTVVLNDLERSGAHLYSTSFVITHGEVAGRHRKTILTEAETLAGITPGSAAAVPFEVTALPVPVAPLICFEHGFPEIAMDLALAGAGVIAISSAIRTGTEYLRNLRTRARAQDNGCYVVAANAVGGGYCGESMIVDPRGDVVALASSTDPGVIVAEVDIAVIEEQRRREPVLRLRRPELRPRH
jgi:predicted amidohydrolase